MSRKIIETKADLKEFLRQDMELYKGQSLLNRLFNRIRKKDEYYIRKYLWTLRHLEYYKNNKGKNFLYKLLYGFWFIRWSRLCVETGMNFFPNTIGPGVKLYHTISCKTGGVSNLIIGSHVTIRPGVGFGYKGDFTRDTMDCPVVEDYVEFSPGAKVYGKIHIGRGSLIGPGAQPFSNVPPYAIVIGNPGKIIGFTKTPEEVIEFEKDKYPEEDRLTLDYLRSNYKKHFLDRIKEIRSFMKID